MYGRLAGMAALACLAIGAGPAAAAQAPPAVAASALSPKADSSQSALLSMTVDPKRSKYRTRTPKHFVGFSVEYPTSLYLTGASWTGTNTLINGLYGNLSATGSGAPSLRVGGGSNDNSAWNPLRTRPVPRGITYDITQENLNRLRDFSYRTGSKLILGANLASTIATARNWMVVANRALGRRVLFYEIGNEPDNYGTRPTFKLPSGENYRPRKRSYNYNQWLREFDRRARGLRKAIPGVRIAGPSSSAEITYDRGLTKFLKKQRRRIKTVAYHEYAGSNCPGTNRPGQYGYMTRGRLLSNTVAQRPVTRYLSIAGRAKKYRKGVWLTETSNVACGGKPGVSDTLTAGLWVADFLIKMVAVGVKGTNFHSFGLYSPFQLAYDPVRGWLGHGSPMYYGMLFFARAMSNNATLLLDSSLSARGRKGSNVVAWSTLDRRKTLRVAVINKNSKMSGPVRLRLRGAYGVAKVSRLLGKKGLATKSEDGVSLGGQTMPLDSPDGRLIGPRIEEPVRKRGGRYTFSVPAASAALLEVKVR